METARERALRVSRENLDAHYQRKSKNYENQLNGSNIVGQYQRVTPSGATIMSLPSGQQLPLPSRAPSGIISGQNLLATKPIHSDKWWSS
jgi:hypothetical protein